MSTPRDAPLIGRPLIGRPLIGQPLWRIPRLRLAAIGLMLLLTLAAACSDDSGGSDASESAASESDASESAVTSSDTPGSASESESASGGATGDEAATDAGTPNETDETPASTPTPVPGQSPPEDVRLLTEDGLNLAGRLIAVNRDRLVVLMHMYGSSQRAWWPMQEQLTYAGSPSVLTFDFRGYGGSDGDRDGSQAEADVRAALQFAAERGFSEVVLIGASMGGTAAIAVAAAHPADIKGVVALSAPEQFRGIDAGAAAAQVRVPLLVIAGTGDISAAAAVERFAERASLGPDRALLLETGAHGTGLLTSTVATAVTDALSAFIAEVWPD